MDLIPFIYCEKQEPGSMLCAQHALNNLLQSPIWSPDNLAEIARKLDSIEFSHLDQNNNNNITNRNFNSIQSSSNYNDSGFFSVQVIDDALHSLGLRIISWKSEEMKPVHDYPENQEAFILNHDLHWFTLRRFGSSIDRWYNLNSMAEDSPKWIGPTFLSMSIAQAEAEGYSIFAVIPLSPSLEPSVPKPGKLIACEADEQALILDQLNYTSSSIRRNSVNSSNLRRPREEEIRGESSSSSRTKIKLENEINSLTYDNQIQIAIQASLTQILPSTSTLNQNLTENYQKEQESNQLINLDFNISNNSNLISKGKVNYPTESTPTTENSELKTTIMNECLQSTDEIESLEDRELAMAISESLLDHTNHTSNSDLPHLSDQYIDEPTPDELRQKRLARFSSQN